MRILVIGDQHMNPIGEYSPLLGGFNSENIYRFENSFEWIHEELSKLRESDKRVDYIVFLGDLYDENGYINPIAKAVIDRTLAPFIQYWGDEVKQIIFLTGNHEMYDKARKISIISYFEYFHKNCEVVTTPRIIDDMVFIPYMYAKEYDDVLAYLNDPNFKLAFTHLDYLGAGMTPKIRSNTGIDINALTTKGLIVNGHYHHPEMLGLASGGKLLNAGAIYYRNHHDKLSVEYDRGIWLIDLDAANNFVDATIIENPHTDYYISIRSENATEIIEELQNLSNLQRYHVKVFTGSTIFQDSAAIEAELMLKPLSIKLYKRTRPVVDLEQLREVEFQKLSKEDAVLNYIAGMKGEIDTGRLAKICIEEVLNGKQ